MENKDISIPNLARKWGVTPQAIQGEMRKIPHFIDDYTWKPHRTRSIAPKGVRILACNKNHYHTNSNLSIKLLLIKSIALQKQMLTILEDKGCSNK